MHEMSVAMQIVKIAQEQAKEAEVEHFASIELEIGSLAGIELDALKSVWKSAVKTSVLEKAESRIITIPALAKCRSCHAEYELDFLYDACPECGSFQKHITQGQELKIRNLELP